MKKLFSKTLQAGSLMMCLSLLPSVAAAQVHKPISLAGPESKLPFSDGMVAGKTLYIAGQEGRTADGKLAEGALWRQESIIGSVFEASYQYRGEQLIPSIRGRAWVNAQASLIFDPTDPFVWGIR